MLKKQMKSTVRLNWLYGMVKTTNITKIGRLISSRLIFELENKQAMQFGALRFGQKQFFLDLFR